MGSGAWSRSVYDNSTTAKVESHGSAFTYTADMKSVPRSAWKAHEDLDPKAENKNGAHAGTVMREALDSDEHPESTPIMVMFDVTGSMGGIPRVLQAKLPALHGTLLRRGYVPHPQILFGAIGDVYCDQAPLQVSQFESDNRMDEHLSKLLLEGGGGGGNHESYDLALYFAARHTFLDSVQKRGRKGYLFIIGDERAYPFVDRQAVAKVIGDNLQENIPTPDIVEEAQDLYHVFYLFARQGSYSAAMTLDAPATEQAIGWRALLGQNAMVLEDADAVCETIALTIGVMEGTVSIAEGMDDLTAVGADPKAIAAAGTAVAKLGEAPAAAGGSIVPTEGSFDEADSPEAGTEAV